MQTLESSPHSVTSLQPSSRAGGDLIVNSLYLKISWVRHLEWYGQKEEIAKDIFK